MLAMRLDYQSEYLLLNQLYCGDCETLMVKHDKFLPLQEISQNYICPKCSGIVYKNDIEEYAIISIRKDFFGIATVNQRAKDCKYIFDTNIINLQIELKEVEMKLMFTESKIKTTIHNCLSLDKDLPEEELADLYDLANQLRKKIDHMKANIENELTIEEATDIIKKTYAKLHNLTPTQKKRFFQSYIKRLVYSPQNNNMLIMYDKNKARMVKLSD